MIGKISLFISTLIIYLVFIPLNISSHFVGFSHHELTFEYVENSLVASYGINLTYPDFTKVYALIDPDQNDTIEESDAAKWLESWNNKVTVQVGEDVKSPVKLYDFSNLSLLKSNLYPSFRFKVDFGKINSQLDWESFKVNHSYRVGDDVREYFSIIADYKTLLFDPTTYPQEFSIEGKLKAISDVNQVENTELVAPTIRNSFTTEFYKYLFSFFNTTQDNSFAIFIIIGLGFIIGVLHSLSPGHGKTIMGTYITMTKSSPKNIVLLASSITLSHIFIVSLLAILFIWLRNGVSFALLGLNINLGFDLKLILPYLSTISGLIVIVIGLFLIFDRLKTNYKPREFKKTGQKNFFSLNTNYVVLNDGNHVHKIPRFEMNTKQSIVLGMSSGLVPCVEIVSLLILAINIEKIWSGIAVLISFSLGMSFTLISIGWIMKKGLDRSQNIKFMENFYKNIPLISAILITISGIFTLIWGLNI